MMQLIATSSNLNLRIYFFIALAFSSICANADILIVAVNETALPYSLSPKNYDNSPRNYSNSVRNYSNSPRNYKNSPRNYANSPRNNRNGQNGIQRLLANGKEGEYYAGYYVFRDDGLINFYAPDGNRLFYSPAHTGAIYHGENGEFCGTIASLDDQIVLALTEKGQLAMAKEGVFLDGNLAPNRSSSSYSYLGRSDGHWIKEIIDGGSTLVLEDGSIWQIDPMDRMSTMLWLPINRIRIMDSSKRYDGYPYLLINTDRREEVHAKYLGKE